MAQTSSARHDHAEMLRRWIWRDFANITLGVWLLSSPLTLGFATAAQTWSDLVSGGLIVVLATLALFPRFDRWNDAIVGVALMASSLPRGHIGERFGGWNRYLVW